MPHQVMLLVLVTGLFAAVWKSDHPVTPLQVNGFASETQAGLAVSVSTSEPRADIRTKRDAAAFQSIDPGKLCLPKRMAPGRFRVVDNLGEVQDVRLTENALILLGVEPDSQSRDLYIQTDGPRRWYFIRVDRANATLAEATPAASIRD